MANKKDLIAVARGAAAQVAAALKDLDSKRVLRSNAKKAVEAAQLFKESAVHAADEEQALHAHVRLDIAVATADKALKAREAAEETLETNTRVASQQINSLVSEIQVARKARLVGFLQKLYVQNPSILGMAELDVLKLSEMEEARSIEFLVPIGEQNIERIARNLDTHLANVTAIAAKETF